MSVTSGFFNSVNGDRKYNAEQMSAIFDGIINDGILANIGTAFTVTYTSGTTVEVGIGRAWFNSTWLYNDAILPLELDAAEVVLDRIDAVVIEIDRSDGVRKGDIKVVKGTPGAQPSRPTMASTAYVHQYPLAYIYRTADSTTFSQADITSMIGTSACPYVTGILQVQSIDNIVAQWQAQWIQWYANETATTEGQADAIIEEWNQWYADQTSNSETEVYQWMTQMKADIEAWLAELQYILDDETATLLTSKITDMEAQFATLTKDRAIYSPLQDNAGDKILDSYGNPIEGTTAFPYGSGNGGELHVDGLVTFPTFEEHVAQNAEEHEEIHSILSSHDARITTANNTANNASSSLAAHIANKNNPHGITPAQIGAYEPSVGDIQITSRTNLGSKWLLCNGATVSRGSYPALSSLIPFSPDGPWTGLIPDTTGGTYGVSSILKMAYGNGYYVGVQRSSLSHTYIGYSTNLASWNTYSLDDAKTDGSMSISVFGHEFCIAFGNGYFVVPAYEYISNRYAMRFYYSQHPHTGWNCTDIVTGMGDDDYLPKFRDITFANGYFVVVAYDAQSSSKNAICYVSTSPSGPWTKYTMLTQPSSSSYYVTPYFVKYVNGYFVSGIGSYQNQTGIAWRAGNPNGGWSFTQINPSTLLGYSSCVIKDCVYANGKYALLVTHSSSSSYISAILESSSLSGPWTVSTIVGRYEANSLCFVNGFYIVENKGSGGAGAVLYSRFSTGPWIESAFTTTLSANGLFYANNRLIRYGSSLMNIDSTNMKLPAISTGGATYAYIKAQA